MNQLSCSSCSHLHCRCSSAGNCVGGVQVKILYVRNLMLSTSEETLENIFNQAAGHCGAVERVKKIKDYAFVHFHDRDDTMRALHVINGTSLAVGYVEFFGGWLPACAPKPTRIVVSCNPKFVENVCKNVEFCTSATVNSERVGLITLIGNHTRRIERYHLLAPTSTGSAQNRIRNLSNWGVHKQKWLPWLS